MRWVLPLAECLVQLVSLHCFLLPSVGSAICRPDRLINEGEDPHSPFQNEQQILDTLLCYPFFLRSVWEMTSPLASNPYLRYTEQPSQGSRVFARSDIPKGSLVLVLSAIGTMVLTAFPLLCSPITTSVSSICHYCFKRFQSLSRCSRCKLARYCSKRCQIADW